MILDKSTFMYFPKFVWNADLQKDEILLATLGSVVIKTLVQ